MPTTPSSAATVSGVVCERFLLAATRRAASSRLAFGCPPTPTPTSGWFRNTVHVTETRRERSLVNFRAESFRTWTATTPAAASTTAAATPATTRRIPGEPTASTSAVTTMKIATMLDCEYENQSAAYEMPSRTTA